MSAETSRHPSLDELSAWVDGEIADTFERQVLAEHVAACVSCASLVQDFMALAAAQVSAPVPPVPFHLQGRVLDRLAGERFGRRPVRRFVLPLSAAATLLIGLVALWLYRQQPASPQVALDRGGRVESHEPERERPVVPVSPNPTPQAPVLQSPPEAELAQPTEKAAPPAPAIVSPAPPPPERAKTFAPVPPSLPRQQPVALQGSSARWMRLPSEPLARSRRDEASAVAGAPAAAEASAPGCAARDLLRPPLVWEGMDAERARELADRVRAAGTSEVILATAPVLRLTVVVPVAAWPALQEVLAASGMSIPDPVRDAPEGGDCLEVAIDPGP
ncbi:MAG TPA: hypothetical protein VFV75_00480 [Candidatus Polarisedimenticolaceae bacterium]|nr:hypothetical protein [Candidatus Polarisedimenticolaceae bacterium]